MPNTLTHTQVRRESTDLDDMFVAHIGAMDTFARGLRAAAKVKKDGVWDKWLAERYASFDSGIGARIEVRWRWRWQPRSRPNHPMHPPPLHQPISIPIPYSPYSTLAARPDVLCGAGEVGARAWRAAPHQRPPGEVRGPVQRVRVKKALASVCLSVGVCGCEGRGALSLRAGCVWVA